MLRRTYLICILFFCAALYGCATLINGSTQDVQFIVPQGTQVRNVFGDGDGFMAVRHSNGFMTLRLKRKKDYTLRFQYKGQEAMAILSSSLEPGWILADFPTSYIGWIVDGATGAWNAFDDPILIRFPEDSVQKKQYTPPSVEISDDVPESKYGIVLTGNLGLVFPMAEVIGTSYGIGLGYEASPKLSFLLSYQGGSGTNIFSQYSSYFASASYSHFDLECRYKVQGKFYLTGGGGLSNITTDSLEISRSSFNDSTGNIFDNPIRSAPVNKWMPTLFAGIGIAGSTTFIELRHTFGLSKIPLPNGEIGKYETTTLTFGVNFHF